jgi:hypothetical protein
MGQPKTRWVNLVLKVRGGKKLTRNVHRKMGETGVFSLILNDAGWMRKDAAAAE